MTQEFKGWETFSYLEWIKDLLYVDSLEEEIQDYYIRTLHDIPFMYLIPMDENRVADGLKLRERYMDENNIPSIFYGEETECSVLEMLAALAVRCCEDLMGIETPGFWFWEWCANLFGEFGMDEDYILDKVDVWLSRDFDKRGYGSPFPIRKGRVHDQRDVDIWLQMCGYISENYVGLE